MHSHILMMKPQPSPKSNPVTAAERLRALRYLSSAGLNGIPFVCSERHATSAFEKDTATTDPFPVSNPV